MTILITGGLGYIGSHVAVELLKENNDIILVDNLSNSSEKVKSTIKQISKKDFLFIRGDITQKKIINYLFNNFDIDTVFHFAGLKSVSESLKMKELYNKVNIEGSKNIINALSKRNNKSKTFIFSSSATVYGNPKYFPIDESHPLNAINPYGETKLRVESLLKKKYKEEKNWKILSLRYFNPVGSGYQGKLGDSFNKFPENLFPYISQVAFGEKPFLKVFGNDYDTPDGTGIRDYIHILDLVDGHIMAYKKLKTFDKFFDIFNLGTGEGYSVSEIINVFEKVNKVKIPFEIYPRRKGDISISYATSTKAKDFFGWKSKNNLKEMCKSEYNHKRILYKNPV